MKSLVIKRSVVLAGHKTSVSLEDAFWNSLREIARGRQMTLSALLASINSGRDYGNFSSAIRLFVLDFYRDQLSKRDSRQGPEQRIGHPGLRI
jgi:predicted DNA-binding ribbon-helix-helix protein